MEDLTKQQIVLLTLFVSFVTSIATGIVTVALMSQAPAGVIQTINKVVERTIEKVVPAATTTQTVIKETVVVNSDDLIVKAIDKNSKSVLRIYRTNADPTSGTDSMAFVALGVVVSDDGIIATDSSLVSDSGKYFATLSDGKLHNLSIFKTNADLQIALLKAEVEDKKLVKFVKATVQSETDLRLGQAVIYIGGESKDFVSTGIISSIGTKDTKIDLTSTTSSSTSMQLQSPIISMETNLSLKDFLPGAPLVNLSGEIIGMRVSFMNSERNDLFVPSKAIVDILASTAPDKKNP